MQQLRQAGIRVWGCATNLYEALALQKAQVDAIIAQGVEAGGHRGLFDPHADMHMGLFSLLPVLKQYISLPLIAALILRKWAPPLFFAQSPQPMPCIGPTCNLPKP